MKTKASFISRKMAVFTAIAGISISSYLIAKDTDNKIVIITDSRPIDRSIQGASFAPMLELATRSVVSVHTAELVRSASSNGQTLDDLFLRRLFGQPTPNQPRRQNQSTQTQRTVPQGVGSGVIISNDGYIMTNNHVVQDSNGGDADEIIVRLFDDTELKAKLIGRDPKTDIAIIKVEAKDLPAAKIADSDQIKVGDKVFAIGNPLGIGMTVTSGIISAKNRSIGIYGNDGYENFIQTDASINQGNSGGALVDIEGRLIGINSAIVSGNGGSVGLGFSIPTNLATNIAEQLTTNGKVRRGIIGVRISPLNAGIAEALGVKGTKGVLVEQVEAGWPAEQAGIRHGDIITHIDGNIIDSPTKLRLSIAKAPLSETIKVTVKRGSKKLDKIVTVKDPSALTQNSLNLFPGTKILPIDNELRTKYNLPPNLGGVVIDQINRDSALNGKIATGTVIMEINRHSINSIEDLGKHFKKNAANLLYIYHRGRASYIAYHD